MIPVAVVESHHHALEHIHGVLRMRHRVAQRRRRQQQQRQRQQCQEQVSTTMNKENVTLDMEPWIMIHIDAHPDLACPSSFCELIPSFSLGDDEKGDKQIMTSVTPPTTERNQHHIPAKACFQPRRSFHTGAATTTTKATTILRRDQDPFHHDPKGNGHQVDKNDNQSDHIDHTKKKDANGDDDNSMLGWNLYEMLDNSSTGIAEWILPLVLTTNLHTVYWIRPGQQQLNHACHHTKGVDNIDHHIPQSAISIHTTGPTPVPAFGWVVPSLHSFAVGAWIPPSSLTAPSQSGSDTTRLQCTKDMDTIQFWGDLPDCALVKVDYESCRYYVEDASVVPSHELLFPQILQLHVWNGEESSIHHHCHDQPKDAIDFVLDICLDYFACINPFISDLETQSPRVCQALVEVVFASRLYLNSSDDGSNHRCRRRGSSNENRNYDNRNVAALQCYDDSNSTCGDFESIRNSFDGLELQRFQALITTVLKQAASTGNIASFSSCIGDHVKLWDTPQSACTPTDETIMDRTSCAAAIEALALEYYETAETARQLLYKLVHVIQNDDDDATDHSDSNESGDVTTGREIHSTLPASRNRTEQLANTCIEALPYLHLPHDSFLSKFFASTKDNAKTDIHDGENAPGEYNHKTLPPEVILRLQSFKKLLSSCCGYRVRCHHDRPMMITLARSANDGFTPPWLVDTLQTRVLELLHDAFCNSDDYDNDDVAGHHDDDDRSAIKDHHSSSILGSVPPTRRTNATITGNQVLNSNNHNGISNKDSQEEEKHGHCTAGNHCHNCRLSIVYDV